MNDTIDFHRMCEEVRHLSGLTARDEATLHGLEAVVVPALDGVADRLFALLEQAPRTAPFIRGHAGVMKKIYRAWLESLFTRPVDAEYARWIYRIGAALERAELPVELMTAGMSLVVRELMLRVGDTDLDAATKARAGAAVGSACVFSQLIFQRSYGLGNLGRRAERVLMIADLSRRLFDNLAAIYRAQAKPVRSSAGAPRRDARLPRGRRCAARADVARCSGREPHSRF